jgi:hypothetical protein
LVPPRTRWCHQKRCADNRMATRWHHPFYLAFLIGSSKSTQHYAFLRSVIHPIVPFSLHKRGQSPTVDPHAICIVQAGSMRSFAFSTGLSHALHQVRNKAVQALRRSHHDGRKQARNSGHSLFRGPARGRSPRARISILLLSIGRRRRRQTAIHLHLVWQSATPASISPSA